jgi:hypothetical protein
VAGRDGEGGGQQDAGWPESDHDQAGEHGSGGVGGQCQAPVACAARMVVSRERPKTVVVAARRAAMMANWATMTQSQRREVNSCQP